MIELLRYARMKKDPKTTPTVDVGGIGVMIKFKRFDVSNGNEVAPEESHVEFRDLEERLGELQIELDVVKELLALKQ